MLRRFLVCHFASLLFGSAGFLRAVPDGLAVVVVTLPGLASLQAHFARVPQACARVKYVLSNLSMRQCP